MQLGGLLAAAFLWWLPAAVGALAPPVLVNLTGSVPTGIYLRQSHQPVLGSLVAACLPAEVAEAALIHGYVGRGEKCPSSTRPVLKRIAGTAGAWVELGSQGLKVDGQEVDRSRIRSHDRKGRPLVLRVSYPYRVVGDHLLLLAAHPFSYDGRYFGPVPRDAVLGTYRPWWIWK